MGGRTLFKLAIRRSFAIFLSPCFSLILVVRAAPQLIEHLGEASQSRESGQLCSSLLTGVLVILDENKAWESYIVTFNNVTANKELKNK